MAESVGIYAWVQKRALTRGRVVAATSWILRHSRFTSNTLTKMVSRWWAISFTSSIICSPFSSRSRIHSLTALAVSRTPSNFVVVLCANAVGGMWDSEALCNGLES